MQDHDSKAPKPDTAGADHSKYLVHSRLEIARILGTLYKSGTMVTAYFEGGEDFILTAVAGVSPDDGLVFLDYGADEETNQRALKADKINFVATHDKIKIQFSSDSLRPARVAGRDVLAVVFPETLLRLQRRDFFRIATPLAKPLKCVVPPQRDTQSEAQELTVIDISCGGIALIDPADPAAIEIGMQLHDCRVTLPGIGDVTMDIDVRSTFELTYPNGAQHRRAGCEFTNISERERALIQRYINGLERDHKHRTSARRPPKLAR